MPGNERPTDHNVAMCFLGQREGISALQISDSNTGPLNSASACQVGSPRLTFYRLELFMVEANIFYNNSDSLSKPPEHFISFRIFLPVFSYQRPLMDSFLLHLPQNYANTLNT